MNVSKQFNYNDLFSFEINCPCNLLSRINESLEVEESNLEPSCTITIHEDLNPQRIKRDRSFPFATINVQQSEFRSLFFKRYDTPIRIVDNPNQGVYNALSFVSLDENAALFCIRDFLSRSNETKKFPWFYSSLVDLNGEGILITGETKQGKTSLMTHLCHQQKADFINDEYTIIEPETVTGLYVPRGVTARFPTIDRTPLKELIHKYQLTGATQYIDEEAIDEMIRTGKFNPRYGLSFSRQRFVRTLETGTKSKTQIKTIIFPKYNSDTIFVSELSQDEGIKRLQAQRIVRSIDTDVYEFRRSPCEIPIYIPKQLRFLEVQFPGLAELQERGFRL